MGRKGTKYTFSSVQYRTDDITKTSHTKCCHHIKIYITSKIYRIVSYFIFMNVEVYVLLFCTIIAQQKILVPQ